MIPLFNDFFSLLYPRLCMACGGNLQKFEDCVCTFCNYQLPRTNFHGQRDNPVEQLFWGKTQIKTATALYYFSKIGRVQNLIHELKYRGHTEVGAFLGRKLGHELSNSDFHRGIKYVIPVPLHKKKLKKRGFNQSEIFAKGLAEEMGILLDNATLYRTKFTESQTKKTRFERWENVSSKFEIIKHEHLCNTEVLLVDDVITTGSTIEACANALLRIEGIKVHIASIAFTA